MPATAGRVRMPANNRVHSSAALQTHGIWQSAIGYDPYAPENSSKASSAAPSQSELPVPAAEGNDNAYSSFQGLLALARITNSNSDETRGACKKCGRVGHLTFQCRNFLAVKDPADQDDIHASAEAAALAEFEKIKKAGGQKGEMDSESEEESESESEDTDADSEMERIIAKRKLGKKLADREKRSRGRSSSRRERKRRYKSEDEDESEEERRKHRKSRKDKKRRSHKREESSDEDSEDSEYERRERKRRHRRRDASGSDSERDSRRRRKRHHRRSASDGSDGEEERGRKTTSKREEKSKDRKREHKY